ncbi:MAG: hypothetical protein KF850_20230 [Labilithrix sp.]|nr:hypothetical protein [Labilithrix sp.]
MSEPVLSGGNIAYATDPDRDRVVIVDPVTKKARSVVSARVTSRGDRHRRSGIAHVVLDRRGAIATIDTVASATVVARRAVSGSARHAREHAFYVACTGGEIVSMPTQPAGAPSVLARRP